MESRESKDQSQYTDKYIVCVGCGDGFLFEAGEQFFFQSKGLAVPKRCPVCREKRRLAIQGVREAVPRW
jgi:hypothetical protein